MKRILLLLTVAVLCNVCLFAQSKITGTVVDKDNQPLMGVQVKSETGDVAVTTDLDGRFEITVPEGSKLTFSMLGTKSKTKEAADGMTVVMGVSDKNPIQWNNIILAEYGFNAKTLNEHTIGIRYGMCKTIGWYVGARLVTSDFQFHKGDGSLDEEDFTTDPSVGFGRPFMTGSSSFSQFTFSAGLLCRMRIPLYGYVGAGYGYRQTVYQTTADCWLKRPNDKSSLAVAELGLIGDIHGFTLSAGCEIIFAGSMEVYPKFGIGYTFPMKKSKSNKGGDL